MDGQQIESDPRGAEYLRQKEVFARSMAELQVAARKREAAGYAVMAAVYSFEDAARHEGLLGKVVTLSKYALIAAVAILPNVAMINVLMD